METKDTPQNTTHLKKELRWFDCSALVVGIMLGTGIFVVFPKLVAAQGQSLSFILGTWLIGTLVAWFGAMCYAELASRFPSNGGDYVFLKETYQYNEQNPISFLFAWTQILIIRPASLLSLSIVMGLNAQKMLENIKQVTTLSSTTVDITFALVSLLALIGFTAIAILGVNISKNSQNFLTVVKMLLVLSIISYGFMIAKGHFSDLTPHLFYPDNWNFFTLLKKTGIALIPVMWVFGGWNEAPYVTEEVKNPSKNIPKALSVGIFSLGFLYILVNFIYLLHLGPETLANSWTFSSDLMNQWFGVKGAIIISVIIFISAAGALNGLIITGGRMTAAFASDYSLLKPFTYISYHFKTPANALMLNLCITLFMALFVDLKAQSIDQLLYFTSGVVWIFFALVVLSIFINRIKHSIKETSFKVPFYPISPLIFLIMCFYMIYGAYDFKPMETLWGIKFTLAGIPVYWLINKTYLGNIETPVSFRIYLIITSILLVINCTLPQFRADYSKILYPIYSYSLFLFIYTLLYPYLSVLKKITRYVLAPVFLFYLFFIFCHVKDLYFFKALISFLELCFFIHLYYGVKRYEFHEIKKN